MSHDNGYLLSIEAIDGGGKSSLARNLAQELEFKGKKVLLTHEPGSTSLGEELRNILHKSNDTDPLAEFFLFAADRSQHFQKVILPALNNGTYVISDRMADSSLAYQGYGKNINKEMIKNVNSIIMRGRKPDVTIYIRISPSLAMERVRKRGLPLTSFEQEKIEFWTKVVNGYEEIYKGRRDVITVDGNMTEKELTQYVLQELEKRDLVSEGIILLGGEV
jgi:dTMP kinase